MGFWKRRLCDAVIVSNAVISLLERRRGLRRVNSCIKRYNNVWDPCPPSLLPHSLHCSAQRLAILNQKLEFLSRHSCVNQSQLEELVKVRANLPWREIQLILNLVVMQRSSSAFRTTDSSPGLKRAEGILWDSCPGPQVWTVKLFRGSCVHLNPLSLMSPHFSFLFFWPHPYSP